MKKILKTAVAVAVAFLTAAAMAVCASAETEDVELSMALAKTSNGSWGQSVTYTKDQFNCDRLTSDSLVTVEFELEGEWTGTGSPIELILQNYSTANPQIWAKVEPIELTDNSATFNYENMVLRYGSDDFSTVDALHIGDCGVVMKVTKLTVTNCNVPEVVTTTTTEAATTTAAETTTAAVTTAAETTAAETTTASSSSESSGGKIPLVPIVIAAVVVAVIVVVIIIVLKSKRRFY